MSNDCESQIRSKLVDVLNTRIPGILTSDFSFVKVSRKTVSEPACRLDQNWDYPQLKVLAGQGKIYLRLLRSVGQITGKPASKPCTNIKSYFEDLPDHLPAHSRTLEDVVPATHTSASIVPSTSLQSTTTVMPGCSQDTMEPSEMEREPMTRPEMSPVCSKCVDTTSQDEKDLETLVQMFPNKNVDFLKTVQKNIELKDCIDDILGEYLSVLDMLLFCKF